MATYVIAYKNFLEKLQVLKFTLPIDSDEGAKAVAQAYIDALKPDMTAIPVSSVSDLSAINTKVLLAVQNHMLTKLERPNIEKFEKTPKPAQAVFDLLPLGADAPPTPKKRSPMAAIINGTLTVTMPQLDDHIAQAKRDVSIADKLAAVAATISEETGLACTVTFEKGRTKDEPKAPAPAGNGGTPDA